MSEKQLENRLNFKWEIPLNQYEIGRVKCNWCKQFHYFEVEETGEIDKLSWETEEDKECDWSFDLEHLASEEWSKNFKSSFLERIGEISAEEKEILKETNLQENLKKKVSIHEFQYDKSSGKEKAVFSRWKDQQEFFRCGLCGKEIKGAFKKGVVKNRNNPAFWGLDKEKMGKDYKVLCLKSLKDKFINLVSKKKLLNQYLTRGYV